MVGCWNDEEDGEHVLRLQQIQDARHPSELWRPAPPCDDALPWGERSAGGVVKTLQLGSATGLADAVVASA